MPNAKEARASADEGDSGADLGKLGLTLAPAARVAGAGAEGVVITGGRFEWRRGRSRLLDWRRHSRGCRQICFNADGRARGHHDRADARQTDSPGPREEG